MSAENKEGRYPIAHADEQGMKSASAPVIRLPSSSADGFRRSLNKNLRGDDV